MALARAFVVLAAYIPERCAVFWCCNETLAQEGAKAYGDAYELVHRREAQSPNAVWQADHCFLDVLVKRDDGTEAKPWLSVILDDYSRALAGYYIAFEAPCAIRTALTLRQAIWQHLKADGMRKEVAAATI